jgi:hypothetical protein
LKSRRKTEKEKEERGKEERYKKVRGRRKKRLKTWRSRNFVPLVDRDPKTWRR